MTFEAAVHNGAVVLPPELRPAEGTVVRIIIPDSAAAIPEWLEKTVGIATTGRSTDEIMRMTRGEDWGKE